MKKNIEEYMTPFFILSDEIKISIKDFEDEWLEDEDPPYILLFAKVGRIIANSFFVLDEKQIQRIFSHIESGINSKDEYLSIAVATGLIEALVTATDDNPKLWDKIESYLGYHSKEYALAWKNFGQE